MNSLPELEIAECEVPHIPCGLALVNITIAIGGHGHESRQDLGIGQPNLR
jgi:hypothetical protein